jgi:predicted Zn-dependent protease with MMP-like domain
MTAEEVLEPAWEALDEGDPQRALAQLRRLERRGTLPPGAAVVAALAWLELEDPSQADRLLSAARGLPEDDLDLRWARAEVDLALWRLERAREGYEFLAREADGPELRYRLALLADLRGDSPQADREVAAALELDPDLPPPPRLRSSEFEAVVARAAADLPPEFRARLEEIAVVVDPVPSAALSGGRADTPPDALGLFVGWSDLERSGDHSGQPGATIYLFQRNLERTCSSPEELEEEIRVTLYHELGHALGFDEDGVDALGLG